MRVGKIIVIASVVVIVFILIVLMAGLQSLSRKPEFTITQTILTDNNGYPSIKLLFKTEKYPLTFKLFTQEGELVDQTIASEGETVEYLSLTGLDYKKNLRGPKVFFIKVYYGSEEIYSDSIEVKGVNPKLTWDDTPLETQTEAFYISIKTIRFRVKNEGDVPLYIHVLSEDFKCYLDGESLAVSVEDTLIMPGEETVVKVSPVLAWIYSNEFDSKHSIEVNLAGSKLNYEIQPLSPRIQIVQLKYEPLFGNTVSLESLTVTIENTWNIPLDARWVEVTINTEKASYSLDVEVKVKPGETVDVTYKLLFTTANKGDRVTVKVKLGTAEAVKQIPIS